MTDANWTDPYLDEEQLLPGGNAASELSIGSGTSVEIDGEKRHRGRGDHGHGHVHRPHRRLGPQLKIRLRHAKGITPRGVLREPLYLPVVLGDSFDVAEEYSHEDYTTAAGEFSAPLGNRHGRNLLTFSNDTMTCTWSPRWITYRHQRPKKVLRELQKIGDSRRPFHFLAALIHSPHQGPDVSCLATLRTLTRSLRHGEPDSRYFTLEFRSYRRPQLGRKEHGGGGHSGRGNRRLPAKHKLDSNDTFRKLARNYYGHETAWHEIAKANGLRHWGGNDPIVKSSKYKVGDTIRIPKLDPHDFFPDPGGSRNPDGTFGIWGDG